MSSRFGGTLLGLALVAIPSVADAVEVRHRGIAPDGFYAIPVSRVRDFVDRPGALVAKLTSGTGRWGPRSMTAQPRTTTGQWYIIPICGNAIAPARRRLVEPTDQVVWIACQ